ncbi:MAG: hypothetical protein WC110_12240 [Bacteroidales bacterium]|jgi:hypothetical protein
MTELSTDKKYEWFIQEIGKGKTKTSDFITFIFGCVEENEIARARINITNDIRNGILYSFMVNTGYKDNGTGEPNPFVWFKRGMHFFARPVKIYRGGDLNTIRWTIDYDTISAQNVSEEISEETLERIKRVFSHAPSKDEAIRRLAKSDPALLYDLGIAVGAGLIDIDGLVTSP